jgi:hypothetical protein
MTPQIITGTTTHKVKSSALPLMDASCTNSVIQVCTNYFCNTMIPQLTHSSWVLCYNRRSVSLGIKHPSGAYDQMFINVRQLRVCWCGVLCLTRGRFCHLQLLLTLASAVILGSESRGAHDHIFSLTNFSGKLSCSNASANRVEVTSNSSTVLTFVAVTVPLSWISAFNQLKLQCTYKTLVTKVLLCICLQRTLRTCVANCHRAVADFTAGTMFTQPLAGNGCPPRPWPCCF